MATFLSEDLSERETVSEEAARLTGYSLTSTGVQNRSVAFVDGGDVISVINVPAGKHVGISGLFEPYPGGLSVESLDGDGMLTANVYWEPRGEIVEELEE